ncbi:hypothetical protein KSB_88380 [Ktedonobacter robiniae]|uniref:Secreted protein n=1 Tax=Ktedonobacter robiniae TaxID=2778365 RepID=A0ABQ3V625_9CHLR|nr:hypothetical protein KSB_88380 [Ktedonobacter robiniae]
MTCVAVMVVELVIPSTRTLSPVVMALAEVELVPFWYVVEDASLTVTFTPADVDIVKLDVDTLPTVPVAPPEAGPDLALDPPPPGPRPPAKPGCPAVAEEEAVAVPLLLLPQATRIAVAASKRKVTLTNVFIFSDSDVRIDIFFPSFYVYE